MQRVINLRCEKVFRYEFLCKNNGDEENSAEYCTIHAVEVVPI